MPFDIPESELRWRFDTSGGPGGQHANRSNTRVELTFDIAHSSTLADAIRERLITKLGPTVTVVEAGSRSQSQNRRRALERLEQMLEAAARPAPPPRRRTRPGATARKRRVERKRARGQLKRRRARPDLDD